MYRIGVDVGGTNTDSAILDITRAESPSRGVVASCKTPTTIDVTSGIAKAVEDVLAESKVNKADVLSVNIGTTRFVNAVVEADERRLSRVAVVRLCGPYTRQIPPFSDFPERLRKIMDGGTYYLDGGLEIDGREITPLNPDQIRGMVEKLREAGVETVALVGVFSPLDHSGIHEVRCKSIMLEQNPAFFIVCSHNIGGLGLLERENATILNASILSLAKKTINGFRQAMSKLQLVCPLYLTQNDGTLTDAEAAAELPIKTFASGPTNSMIGAAFLAGLDKPRLTSRDAAATQILVVDVGGTTTDVCALLRSGFPRQAPNFVEVGGVRTAFSMPEVLSIGLGGGSIIRTDKEKQKVTVGPDSVGHLLTKEALVYSGSVTTATDIAVASGKQKIGNADLVAGIPSQIREGARKQIRKVLESLVENMKVSTAPVTVLLVGGGSILLMDDLQGIAECIIPPHHDSANAVGAAIAKVAGGVDVIEILDGKDEKTVVTRASEQAIQMAVLKGAVKEDVKIVTVEKFPLQYVFNKATRIVVNAVGKLGSAKDVEKVQALENIVSLNVEREEEEEKRACLSNPDIVLTKPSLYVDIPSYRPDVQQGVWYLSEVDLEFIAIGTGVLGTGGGGPSYLHFLVALDALRNGGRGKMRVISPKALRDSDVVCFGSWYGAPSVSNERIHAGTEIPIGIDTINRLLGYKDFDALLADEIGGGNGLASFPTSVQYDKPIVDGDTMGRAYPTLEHGTPYVYGHPITPCAVTDPKGNVSVVMSAESNAMVEKLLRKSCIELGISTSVVSRPLTGEIIKEYAIPHTLSQAWYLGRAIRMARKAKTSYINAIFDVTPGKLLLCGKIIDVRRDVNQGFTMGHCLIAPLSDDEQEAAPSTAAPTEQHHLMIPFQNEYLYAAYIDADGEKEREILCSVPDLISILGQDGEAIGSQELRYGLKVSVIGMPAHPLWTGDERGLKVGGPGGFALKMQWRSVGAYERPRSVIEDFDGA
ncbi:hypothetical protein MMC30_002019 [Trapelia coarctata]|nr:hypothetical protein [Trapelia coarctata]